MPAHRASAGSASSGKAPIPPPRAEASGPSGSCSLPSAAAPRKASYLEPGAIVQFLWAQQGSRASTVPVFAAGHGAAAAAAAAAEAADARPFRTDSVESVTTPTDAWDGGCVTRRRTGHPTVVAAAAAASWGLVVEAAHAAAAAARMPQRSSRAVAAPTAAGTEVVEEEEDEDEDEDEATHHVYGCATPGSPLPPPRRRSLRADLPPVRDRSVSVKGSDYAEIDILLGGGDSEDEGESEPSYADISIGIGVGAAAYALVGGGDWCRSGAGVTTSAAATTCAYVEMDPDDEGAADGAGEGPAAAAVTTHATFATQTTPELAGSEAPGQHAVGPALPPRNYTKLASSHPRAGRPRSNDMFRGSARRPNPSTKREALKGGLEAPTAGRTPASASLGANTTVYALASRSVLGENGPAAAPTTCNPAANAA